jgi:ubiquinone/menaquinone biosynthesis C-methylase UbiE
MLERAHEPERMDDRAIAPDALALALADLRAVNRWLGGTRIVRRHLARLLDRLPAGSYRVLDVATGSADIPLALARWARRARKDQRLDFVATDLHPGTVAAARANAAADPDVRIEQADALALPYADGAFDFALCATALHHFERRDAVRVLRELGRVARRGVIVSDLRRSRAALLGARLLAATAWRRNPITRHDGPLSVRRAFTPAELRELAKEAGLAGARVSRHAVFRVALVVDRTGSGA